MTDYGAAASLQFQLFPNRKGSMRINPHLTAAIKFDLIDGSLEASDPFIVAYAPTLTT